VNEKTEPEFPHEHQVGYEPPDLEFLENLLSEECDGDRIHQTEISGEGDDHHRREMPSCDRW